MAKAREMLARRLSGSFADPLHQKQVGIRCTRPAVYARMGSSATRRPRPTCSAGLLAGALGSWSGPLRSKLP